jgi:medium-chain acyl-[acyl-carrier-protein] hydrolase
VTRNPWIVRPSATLAARVRLFCLPHAGGAASVFQPWAELLPPWIDLCAVQLPGRQQRAREPMPTRMALLVKDLAEGLADELDLPFALLGSCTGSLVAYELLARLREHGGAAASHLFVTSCRAPHLPDRDLPIHGLADAELIRELDRLGGTPPILLEHPDMIRVLGPTLRRDFELAETYRHRPREPIGCPLTVFGGADDRVISDDELAGWHEHASDAFRRITLPGGHYLVQDATAALCAAVAAALGATA